MSSESTAGLSSPYQVTDHTARTELGHNLLDTSGVLAIPILEVVNDEELAAKLAESEVIFIRVSPEQEELTFHLLSKVCQIQSLPDHIYALRRADLRFLEEAGIAYENIRPK